MQPVSNNRLTVQCPDCETENELGYRFCRECVAELPGAMKYREGQSSPFGRFIQ